MKSIRLLLVDDHQILREGLRRSFEAAGHEVVGEAGNGLEGVEQAEELEPEIVLMDLSMPVMDGVEATRQIRERVPATRVVVLTMHDDVARTREALGAGANGYLSKGSSFAEVLTTIEAVADGETGLSPELAVAMLRSAVDAPEPEDGPLLSERQIEILQAIADGQTTKQAARSLGIAQKTVHNHLNAIYRRLDTQSLTHAVLSAVRLGIISLD
ncbi:MAG: response regulator transcription factor [Actinomycetota bacterium]